MRSIIKTFVGIAFAAGLSACGTTFELPLPGDAQTAVATRMFTEAHSEAPRKSLSAGAAERRFARVAKRVSPVGRQYCQTLMAERASFNCNVDIDIDREMKQRNAYFTYQEGKPIIRISMPMLQDSASDDEVAFILSHEYGHLLGRHIEKQEQQALAGALILGVIAAAASVDAGHYDSSLVDSSMEIGAAAGSMAYSQTYELESDTLGARIAHAAGYDPVEGAKFFARPEAARTEAGKLSFWGTHPPDARRLATVLATVEQIEANVDLQKVQ